MTSKSKQLIKALLIIIVLVSITGYCMESPEKISEYIHKITSIDKPQ